MSDLLARYNNAARTGKNIIEGNGVIRRRENLLHVCVNSPGCRFRESGSCIMCNYGEGHTVSKSDIIRLMEDAAARAENVDSILIGALGSIFDTIEVSKECLALICDSLNRMPVETVIFETHYAMLNEKLCEWLKEQLPHKDIVIEVGLESADSFVLDECFNKKINLDMLKEKIDMLHTFKMSVTANILLGCPFLSVSMQNSDAVNTIRWAIDNKVDSVVIFPVNVRRDTLLDYLYRNGRYKRVFHWQMTDVLNQIPVYYLNRIYLAWYGDWVFKRTDGSVENLPPFCCSECEMEWRMFYHKFALLKSSEDRKRLLVDFLNKEECCCRKDYRSTLDTCEEKKREERVAEAHAWLLENSGIF